ncbi:MAG: helix-turn-helix transcriptional regulator [Afipia sp.]|nr:helix-turn-helix transcriptional regulator [Afipia sp.]
MRRKSLVNDTCPIARTLDVIGDWWSLLIVREAMMGTRRFSEFQKHLGVARNILSTRLKTLVAQGIFDVKTADGSAYQDYVLTPKGRALFPVLVALRQWGEEHSFRRGESYAKLLDRQTRRPLQKLQIRAFDGRILNQADTVVEPVAVS